MPTYSLHKIASQNQVPFSTIDYSKFKFGNKSISRKFGLALAEGFINEFLKHNPISSQIVVCSSPYHFIPTATFALKDYFIQGLNKYLVENGMEAVEEAKIYRSITYTEDYGAMSAEEREKLIGGDEFYIDKNFVKGKTVIFLDDIKITGSHERVIERMIEKQQLETSENIFLYFAELVNKEIDPKIENVLNHAYVKSLKDLDTILKSKDFILNTRMVKYILNANQIDFSKFARSQPNQLLKTIYNLSIGNKYYKIQNYKINLEKLKTLV